MATTPGPTTRARSRQATPAAGALPAVDPKASYGYGARGKATLRTQIVQQDTEFDTAFQAAAARPEMDDEDRIDVRASSRANRAPAPRKTAAGSCKGQQPSMAPVAESEEVLGDRNATVMGAPPPGYGTNAIPSAAQVTVHTIPRYVPRVVRDAFKMLMFVIGCAFALVTLLQLVFVLVPSTARTLAPVASSFSLGYRHLFQIPPFNTTADSLQAEWLAFKYEKMSGAPISLANATQQQHNWLTAARLTDLEKRMRTVEQRLDIHDDSYKVFFDLLPQAIILKGDDGKAYLPDIFWSALGDGLAANDSRRAIIWNRFLADNERKVAAWALEMPAGTEMTSGSVLVTKESLIAELSNQYSRIASEHSEELRKAEMKVLDDVRNHISKAMNDVDGKYETFVEKLEARAPGLVQRAMENEFQQLPARLFGKIQAQSLAYAAQVINTQRAISSVNYFSFGLGARIDPRFTASTFSYSNPGWLSQWLLPSLADRPNPPVAALMRWDEATECWCGATALREYNERAIPGPDDENTTVRETQIAVGIPDKIYPKTLVVEHVHRLGTKDIASAPRALEVWADVGSAAIATNLTAKIAEEQAMIGFDRCHSEPPPSPSHVCIMAGYYNIHHDNWVQDIKMNWAIAELKIASNHFIIRARDNWGRDKYTCLYRLRMLGDLVVEEPVPPHIATADHTRNYLTE